MSHCQFANCVRAGRKLSHCARCESVQYCSKECQLADWQEHKKICKSAVVRHHQDVSKKFLDKYKSSCKMTSPDSCAICLEDFKLKPAEKNTELGCRHKFHLNCFRKWLKFNNVDDAVCPVCRSWAGSGELEAKKWWDEPALKNVHTGLGYIFQTHCTETTGKSGTIEAEEAYILNHLTRAMKNEESARALAMVAKWGDLVKRAYPDNIKSIDAMAFRMEMGQAMFCFVAPLVNVAKGFADSADAEYVAFVPRYIDTFFLEEKKKK